MSKRKYKEVNAQNSFQISSRVSIPINTQSDGRFVPDNIEFKDHDQLLEQVAIGIKHKLPMLLVGETGSGKTSLVRFLAHKTRNGFRRVNHNGATTTEDILGKVLINKEGTYWIDGVLIDAMRRGDWYLADEINASPADINFAYHALLDDDGFIVLSENNGEIVRPHPNFRFFAAMNPSSDYVGAKELNKALMSRFLVLKAEFPGPKVESAILQDRCGLPKDVADNMVKFAVDVRLENQKGGDMQFVLSTRDLIMWAKLFRVYGKYIKSAEMAVLNKVPPDNIQAIKDFLTTYFGGLDNPKKEEVKTTSNTVEEVELE